MLQRETEKERRAIFIKMIIWKAKKWNYKEEEKKRKEYNLKNTQRKATKPTYNIKKNKKNWRKILQNSIAHVTKIKLQTSSIVTWYNWEKYSIKIKNKKKNANKTYLKKRVKST